jgi:ribonuclease HII
VRNNLDRELWQSNTLFCGVDEVGRGALAGPVVAAAVVLPPNIRLRWANDSKKVTELRRGKLEPDIKRRALAWAIESTDHHYIEDHNVANAVFHAMREAVRHLSVQPELVICDGFKIPDIGLPCRGIVDGDAKSLSIACASIIAKVYRDRLMTEMAGLYPGYGFERHVGYGTAEHLKALKQLGPSPIHRRTYGPVRELIAATTR